MHRMCLFFMFVFLQVFWLSLLPIIYGGGAVSHAVENQDQADIQWFKEEMKIAPKYVEEQEGIWGMSWGHFFIMVFLVLFFIGALAAVYMRNKRTREILALMLKEEKNDFKG
jgi:ABC-type phosphate transport system permease subunit